MFPIMFSSQQTMHGLVNTGPVLKSDGISSCKLRSILALPEAWLWLLGPPPRANTWPWAHTNSVHNLWATTWKQSRGKWHEIEVFGNGLERSCRLGEYLVIAQSQIILAFGTFTKGVTVGGEQEPLPQKVIWETVTRGQNHVGECQIVLSL